jgi:hypothetical protein
MLLPCPLTLTPLFIIETISISEAVENGRMMNLAVQKNENEKQGKQM